MFITRHALADAGLKVRIDKGNLSIQGTRDMPQGVKEHVDGIAEVMGFNPMEHDELISHIGNVSVWRALKGCPTEV